MANHKSAEKRIRQTAVRTEINRARKAKVKTLTKKVHSAVESGDTTAAKSALNTATRTLQRTATQGTLHKNTVARRISRLARAANKTGTVDVATKAPAKAAPKKAAAKPVAKSTAKTSSKTAK